MADELELGPGASAGACEASAESLRLWRVIAGASWGVSGAGADLLVCAGGLVGSSLGGADAVGRLGGGVALAGVSGGVTSCVAAELAGEITVIAVQGATAGSSAVGSAVLLRKAGVAGWCWGRSIVSGAGLWAWGAAPAAGRSETLVAPLRRARPLEGASAGCSACTAAVEVRRCDLEGGGAGCSACMAAACVGRGVFGAGAGASACAGRLAVAVAMKGASAGAATAAAVLVSLVPLRGLCGAPGWERPQLRGAAIGRTTPAGRLTLSGVVTVELESG